MYTYPHPYLYTCMYTDDRIAAVTTAVATAKIAILVVRRVSFLLFSSSAYWLSVPYFLKLADGNGTEGLQRRAQALGLGF